MTIKDMRPKERAKIVSVGAEGAIRQHFLDMGIIPGAEVTLVQFAPMGDPVEIRLHGYELTLRVADAEKITVEKLETDDSKYENSASFGKVRREHPGLGETGKYHLRDDANAVPKEGKLTFALVGNQNCGKTTLFNQLTGANRHVGNFPGVTVERTDGVIKGYPNTEITDLPGIYSMSPYSSEEIVTRRFIIENKPDCIINIVDATNIERNLYLTMQLMELDIPMVLAVNMMDELVGNGGTVLINEMEARLGIPVVPISAAKNQGVDELIRHAIHLAEYEEKHYRTDFCADDGENGAVHRSLHAIMHLIEDHAKEAEIPKRFAATKLLEGDLLLFEELNLTDNEKDTVEHIRCQLEEERGLDCAAALADMRFSFIEELSRATVKKPRESKEHIRSRKIDKILTGKFTAIPAFIGIMAAIFYLSFNVIGAYLQGLLEFGIEKLTELCDTALSSAGVNEGFHALIIDGIFGGVGSVLSFIPVIITLFFFLSLLEDSGYMARIAFVMDKLLRKIGLSGRSIVPMLIGFGCTVPGVMASRTLPSERDRKLTIMLTPFMSCTAKLPIYGFFTDVFFPNHSGLIMVGLYFVGILVGIIFALISNRTMFKGEAVPFVMELPNYRMPAAKNVARLLWDKAKDFISRAFTVIFVASVIIWFLQSFDFGFNLVDDSADSMLAKISGIIAPVFAPLGFGDWRVSTALISGFLAKESVVSTLTVLFGAAVPITSLLTPSAAASLLVFCLLYTPCVAAVASIKRELGGKWAFGIVILQCAIAWVCAGLVKLLFIFF